MSKPKLTRWFPADVKPVRDGVYELPANKWRAFAYWNGSRFGYRCWTGSGWSAEQAAQDAFESRNYETCLPELDSWRGLAKEPK